jgi:hypothetical protein
MKVSGPSSGAGAGAPDPAAGLDQAAGGTEVPAGGSGAAEVGAADATGAIQRAEGSGRAFAEKLAAAGTPAGATGPSSPTAARPPELTATAAIASELDAGRLTPAAAVNQILEQVLAQQVGPDAPAAVRESVRAALQDALENDPLLAEQLRRLGA